MNNNNNETHFDIKIPNEIWICNILTLRVQISLGILISIALLTVLTDHQQWKRYNDNIMKNWRRYHADECLTRNENKQLRLQLESSLQQVERLHAEKQQVLFSH